MNSCLRLSVLIALPLALAACKDEKKPAGAGTAQGEILEGSISDAMLPLDTVRSEPPLAPPSEAVGNADRSASRTAPAEDTDAGEDADSPAAIETAADPAEDR